MPRATERLRFMPGPADSEAMTAEPIEALFEIWDRLELELKAGNGTYRLQGRHFRHKLDLSEPLFVQKQSRERDASALELPAPGRADDKRNHASSSRGARSGTSLTSISISLAMPRSRKACLEGRNRSSLVSTTPS